MDLVDGLQVAPRAEPVAATDRDSVRPTVLGTESITRFLPAHMNENLGYHPQIVIPVG
jgi:hypothetical protein